MANFVLPYEPDDVRHIDEEKRRREIKSGCSNCVAR
jgi:hypothetical protein